MIAVQINRLKETAKIPNYMSLGAAGCDICACLDQPQLIEKGQRKAIPTGLAVAIPEGYEIQVRPRSGLAFKKGLTVVNAPGTIDSDYRGEVMILVINLGEESISIQHGDRVAQLVLQKVDQIQWEEVVELSATGRGVGGFGSTGVTSTS